MKKIYQIIKKPFAVYHFVEAWDLLARGESQEAEKRFSLGKEYNKNLLHQFLIMKGKIKFSLRKRQECADCFLEALKKLDKGKNLPIDNSLYLRSYITRCLEFYKEHLNYDFKPVEFVPIERIDLQKVNKNSIKRFPSRNHRDWDKYGC